MAGQHRTAPYASLSVVDSGQLQPGTSLTVLPNKPCKLAMFKAGHGNSGFVTVGKLSGLVSGAGSNGGITLAAREWSPWFPITNLNKFASIAQNTGDWLQWIILK